MAAKSSASRAVSGGGVERRRINGHASDEPPRAPGLRLEVAGAALEARFARLIRLAYDTSVPLTTLREEVYPYLASKIEFVSPWLRARGVRTYVTGLNGLHRLARLDLDILQLNVKMNEARDGGRVIVDGVINLRQLRLVTYPLRALLTYEFVLTEAGESFRITRHEEVWSLGDMIASAPLAGRFYEALRALSGRLFAAASWVSCAISERRGAEARSPAVDVRPAR